MENNKIFINRKIERQLFHMAPVEIIIPFHGEQSHVSKLMDSIFQTVLTNKYLITLVDDGSENESFIKDIDNAKIPGVRCFKQEKQKGFGASINVALAKPWTASQIPWVAIMHSDVFAEDNNWLINLGKTLIKLKSGGVKMVSSMTNNSTTDFDFLLGKKNEIKQDFILNKGFLPMYSVLAHRELFKRVGPFREFPYAGVEVEDYAKRMNQQGYKQAVCGSSWVNHVGSVTLNNFSKDDKAQKILRKAREEYESSFEKEL